MERFNPYIDFVFFPDGVLFDKPKPPGLGQPQPVPTPKNPEVGKKHITKTGKK